MTSLIIENNLKVVISEVVGDHDKSSLVLSETMKNDEYSFGIRRR